MSSTTEELRQKGVEIDTDGIRATFRAMVERSGRPLAQIAPETAVAYQTLSAWTNNKYTGNNDRIDKQISAWITTTRARDRARSTMREKPPFVMTKTASRIWEVAEFAQTMPQMALVSADLGVGKTTAIEAYAAMASNVWVVTTEPVHNQMGALLDLISRTLKMEHAQSAAAKSRLIQQRLRDTKGLLIVDEVQNLTAVLRDQLRSMVFDGAGVGVLLVGNEKLRLQFSRERMTGENAQLFSRIGLRFSRTKPLKEDVAKLLDAWGVDDEKAREAALGIAMKPGANRVMSHVLVLAFSLADVRGDEAPSLADVETAWQQLGGELLMGSIDRVQAQATRMESRLTRDQAEGIAWWNGLTEDAREGWCLLAGSTDQPDVWAHFKFVIASATRATPRVVAPGAMFSGACSAAQHLAWLANWVRMAARAGVMMAEEERRTLIRALDGGLSDVPLSSDVGKRLVPLLTMLSAETAAREGRVS